MDVRSHEAGLRVGADTPLNEIVRLEPGAVAVFARLGMDACCGGALPLGEACRRHGLDLEAVLAELRALEG